MKPKLYKIEIYYEQGVSEERKVLKAWNNETQTIDRIVLYTWSCYGQGGQDVDYLDMTPEIQEKVDDYMRKQFNESVSRQVTKLTNEAIEFNERKPYQEKGQLVRIIKGRKYKGMEGVVFWEGFDKYASRENNNQSFKASTILAIINDGSFEPSRFNRIGLKTKEEEVIWISTDYVEVVEGFRPAVVDIEKAAEIVKRRDENFKNLFRI